MVIYHYEGFVYINHQGKNYSDTIGNYKTDGGSYDFHGYTEYDEDTDLAIIDGQTVDEVPHDLLAAADEIDALLVNQSKRVPASQAKRIEVLALDPTVTRRALVDLDERISALEEDNEGEEENEYEEEQESE